MRLLLATQEEVGRRSVRACAEAQKSEWSEWWVVGANCGMRAWDLPTLTARASGTVAPSVGEMVGSRDLGSGGCGDAVTSAALKIAAMLAGYHRRHNSLALESLCENSGRRRCLWE